MAVHIGKEIKKVFVERKMTVVALSRELGCHRTNIYRIFDSPTVDSGVLSRLSVILDFDFFKLYSEEIAPRLSDFDKENRSM